MPRDSFAYAPAPVGLSVSHAASVGFLVILAVLFLVTLCWTLRRLFQRDALPICIVLAGVVASLLEPTLDVLSMCWYARDNVAVAFTGFGISLPVFCVIGYGFFFGAQAYSGLVLLERGADKKTMWRLYAVWWCVNYILEFVGTHLHAYTYYGPQPFSVFGVPLWFMFINTAMAIVSGTVFFVAKPILQGVRALWSVPLLTSTYGALYLGTCWPIFLALHSDVPAFVMWVAAAVSVGLALMAVHVALGVAEGVRSGAGAFSRPQRDLTSVAGPA
jgi:hypothetical protein